MVRAITFDAFGTLIDTGRDVLIRIARSVCEDQRPSLDAEALLATWDRHFFARRPLPSSRWARSRETASRKPFANTATRRPPPRKANASAPRGPKPKPTPKAPQS